MGEGKRKRGVGRERKRRGVIKKIKRGPVVCVWDGRDQRFGQEKEREEGE